MSLKWIEFGSVVSEHSYDTTMIAITKKKVFLVVTKWPEIQPASVIYANWRRFPSETSLHFQYAEHDAVVP